MKHSMLFAFTIIVISLTSCKKNVSTNDNNNTLIGEWSIVNDSTYVGVGIANHPAVYNGQSGDHFEFKLGGKLFINEDGKLRILNYDLTSDSTVMIDAFLSDEQSASVKCTISRLSMHDAIISSPISATPGGVFGRKVHLRR